MKAMIVGGGGRESAFAACLAANCRLHAVMPHQNPTIARCAMQSGGAFAVGNPADASFVLARARQWRPDLSFINADDPLANGITDALRAAKFRVAGASRAAARVEWDKLYALNLMRQICPSITPFYISATNAAQVAEAIARHKARGSQVAVKPQGLTGGKGVRVMGRQLPNYDAAQCYALQLLSAQPCQSVILAERLHGPEFTLMALCDGDNMVFAPATYDYPYRHEGDAGEITGGMGCFAPPRGILPFLPPAQLQVCQDAMRAVAARLRADGSPFNGVLNGGFFLTAQGIRFMEFNSRFGDPEALSVLPLLRQPLIETLQDLCDGTLTPARTQFDPRAAVVKCGVAAEYPHASPAALQFSVDEDAIAALGVSLYYGACQQNSAAAAGGRAQFQTLKKSRVLALAAQSDDAPAASERINQSLKHVHGDLHFRPDIASAAEMHRLASLSPAPAAPPPTPSAT